MNANLFKAILAMDAYNRGYNAGIKFGNLSGNNSDDSFGVKIGNSQIITGSGIFVQNGSRIDIAAGFYGIAYQLSSGEKVIAYRGTDNENILTGDPKTGWGLGGGDTSNAQGQMAIKFYQSVAGAEANWRTANISLTGHSLGGGLAGYVGALYNKNASLFDGMTFELAAQNAYDRSREYKVVWRNLLTQKDFTSILSPEDLKSYQGDKNKQVLSFSVNDLAFKQSVYVAMNINDIPKIDLVGISGTYVDGEVLGYMLPLRGGVSELKKLDLGNDITMTSVGPIDRHSMATLAIRMYADVGGVGSFALPTDWQLAAKYFWPVMYDNAFANAIGMSSVAGQAKTDGDFSGILRQLIAYSAIDEGTRVYGDTAIRSFYNDANDLGRALGLANLNRFFTENARWISESFIHYAGQLALSKTLVSNNASSIDGIFNLIAGSWSAQPVLDVNFDSEIWKNASGGVIPNMVARNHLFDSVWNSIDLTGQTKAFAQTQMKSLWGANTADIFDHFYFSVAQGGYEFVFDTSNPKAGRANFIIGTTDADIIWGTNENDLIYGGDGDGTLYGRDGNDIFILGSGNNIISGGDGIDSVSYAGETSGVTVKGNTIQKAIGADTIYHDVERITLSNKDDVVMVEGRLNVDTPMITFDGSLGIDTVNFYDAISFDMNQDFSKEWEAAGYRFKNFEKINVHTSTLYASEDVNITFDGNKLITSNGLNIYSYAWDNEYQNINDSVYRSGLDYSRAKSSAVFYLSQSLNFDESKDDVVYINGHTHKYSIDDDGAAAGGPRYVRGTDNGDEIHTWTIANLYGNYSIASMRFISGLGNDIVYAEKDSGTGLDYVYTGGNDIIYNSFQLSRITFGESITSKDVTYHFTDNATNGLQTVNITIKGHGSLTLMDYARNQGGGGFYFLDYQGKILVGSWRDDNLVGAENRAQTISGGNGNDRIDGGDLNDYISGGSGNDALIGGAGNDYLGGGEGNDAAVFSGLFANYTISGTGSGAGNFTVKDNIGADGTDTLANIEKLVFSNGTYENGIFSGLQANRVPILGKDSVVVDEDKSVVINVLANDTDPDGNTLAVASVGKAANGKVIINANNTVTYAPNADYNGSDSFLYTVSDGKGGMATQRVNVTINPIDDVVVTNQNPVLGKDAATVGEDKAVVINVLANDTDPDGNALTIASVGKATNGLVVINANNTITYTPNADYNGSDSFLYTVSDGKGGTATQRANITVASVKDADIEGTNLVETLNGTANAESIAGLGGTDTLYAGAGNDTLYGGYGADSLYGQGGADIFVFERRSAFDAVDTVKDFKLSDADKLDIKDMLIGYDSVTSAIANFVEITTSGANSIVKVDRDGAGATYTWQQIAILNNVTGLTDEAALKASGNLIAA